ncbi:MAG: hypothetical protein AB1330_01340 [Bacillota bacterium]
MAKPFEFQEILLFENKLPAVSSVVEGAGFRVLTRIEAIHAGVTKNFNEYTEEELRRAVRTWLKPYPKPVLTNHQIFCGEPIGRVQNARLIKSPKTGAPAIELVAAISEREAAEKVLDGRYITVSVGGICEHAYCSICGVDLTVEDCEHRPGRKYNKKLCTYRLAGITFMEVSFVNVPADENAQVTGVLEEGYLWGEESLVSLSNPERNVFESEDYYMIAESLGIGPGSVSSGEEGSAEVLTAAHTQLHSLWSAQQSDDYVRAHTEVVRQMVNLGMVHEELDGLDETLPEALRSCRKGEKEAGDENISSFFVILSRTRADLEDSEARRQAAEARAEELEQKIIELEEKVGELTKERDRLVQEAAEERQRFLYDNQRLVDELHQELAGFVVSLKCALGESGDKTREELLKEYLDKSCDTLRELLSELLGRLEDVLTTTYNVEDPTLSFEGDEVCEDEQETALTKIGALMALFRGPNLTKRINKEAR